MTNEIHVAAFEDSWMFRNYLQDAVESTRNSDQPMRWLGAHETVGSAIRFLQAVALGQETVSCIFLDGNLGLGGPEVQAQFDSGEGKELSAASRGMFRRKSQPHNPNLFSIEHTDTGLGSDARTIMRVAREMRSRGLWNKIAFIGYSSDPMSGILSGEDITVDYDLTKANISPEAILASIARALASRGTA